MLFTYRQLSDSTTTDHATRGVCATLHRDLHPPQKIAETRVVAHGIKCRVDRDVAEPLRAPRWAGFALLPLAAGVRLARRRRRARRLNTGCCIASGYDLRATPDRCPECGTIPAR
jgi:hypothetical protein